MVTFVMFQWYKLLYYIGKFCYFRDDPRINVSHYGTCNLSVFEAGSYNQPPTVFYLKPYFICTCCF